MKLLGIGYFCLKGQLFQSGEKFTPQQCGLSWLVSQFFLVFFLSLSFSTSALTQKKDFICGYKAVVEYVNSLISLDQQLILQRRSKLRTQDISKEERRQLVLSLMRYRLLPIKEELGRCRFYSFLCLQEQKQSLRQIAEKHLRNQPQGPKACYIRSRGQEQKAPLLSETCESAIKKRVRPIPFPLGIAQAGLESAWGSSYFAKKGYNFFGVQTTFTSARNSINNVKCIPARKNKKKCVYKFDSPENSFFIYSQILNSSNAYIRLRNHRYHSEMDGDPPCKTALKMTQGLDSYATDPKYKSKVRNTIHQICDTVQTCH